MSKWLITIQDKDTERMQELADSENYLWINEWVGEAVEIIDIQEMEN